MLISLYIALILQEAESNRLCRRLQLKDIIPVEMQRLTKYPLLLENIAKYTGIKYSVCLCACFLIIFLMQLCTV